MAFEFTKMPRPEGSLLIRDYNNSTWPGLYVTLEDQKKLLEFISENIKGRD